MAVEGIDYLYLETRNWGKAVKFWQELGYEVELDLVTSGRLRPKSGGPGLFIEEVSPETPLTQGIYLCNNDPDFQPGAPVEIVGDPITTHWGATLLTIRDPDGREFMLHHSPPG